MYILFFGECLPLLHVLSQKFSKYKYVYIHIHIHMQIYIYIF